MIELLGSNPCNGLALVLKLKKISCNVFQNDRENIVKNPTLLQKQKLMNNTQV